MKTINEDKWSKTLDVDGTEVLVLRVNGKGDGGILLRYYVKEEDGNLSEVGEWYGGPGAEELASAVLASPDDAHLKWTIDEARRQVLPVDERPQQAELVKPAAMVEWEAAVEEAATESVVKG